MASSSSSNTKKKSRKLQYSEEFRAMLARLEEEDKYDDEYETEEEEDEGSENGGRRRKRKLSQDQVRALEAKFQAERRLELPRKAAIAAELGLEPRQVAVWFQNRRARHKSKQLEKEFSRLQALYGELQRDYESLERETNSLAAEVKELEAQVEANSIGSKESDVNMEPATATTMPVSEAMTNMMIECAPPPPFSSSLWAMEDAYVAGQQDGAYVADQQHDTYMVGEQQGAPMDGELGGMASAWDFAYEFDQQSFF